MADDFGLRIGVEGEKEFKKALAEINQSFKVLGSEMKLVSSQFDKNDSSVQALSARNTVLNKEIDAQRQKVETLCSALQNAAESFGENDRRTQNWQVQLNNAEAALNGMERELSQNEQAIEALNNQEEQAVDATERLTQEISRQEGELAGLKRAYSNAVLEYGKGSSEARELEGRIADLSGELEENRDTLREASDSTEDFGDAMEDASDGAGKLGSGLSAATVAMGNLISSGIQAALNGIRELGSAIWNLDEATEEYRAAQGKLTTAFEAAGYSGEAAQKSYTEFYKILGDTDTAAEASQLLAQLAENEQDITKWTNIAAGVCGTFGDALPIEGLIESANETAKVGQVTGSLADALNWVGISEDEFNEKLAACSGESERNRLIMETLSGTYDEASQAFYRNNEALVASREGQARMDETLAGLGETISNVKKDVAECFRGIIEDREVPRNEKIIDGYTGFLFLDKNGNPEVAMHWEHRFNHMVKRYNEIYRVQMPNITPHVCRHTYCSNMAKSGMNPKTLQYLMGHSDIGVTLNTYTHLGLEDAADELKRMEDLEVARKELEKAKGEKPVSQKMFRAI